MAQTRASFVPNGENTRKSGTITCRDRLRVEKAEFAGAEREKTPIKTVSVTVASREKP